jgi:K+-transporting ATPase KdpF subunit
VTLWYWIGALLSAAVFLYLVYALLRAEDF